MAGCTVRFGDFEVSAGEDGEDDGRGTSTPKPTPTARPTTDSSPTARPTTDSSPTERSTTNAGSTASTDSPRRSPNGSFDGSIEEIHTFEPPSDFEPVVTESLQPQVEPVLEDEIQITATATESRTATRTDTPSRVSFKIHDLALHLEQADDAALNKPNTAELFGKVDIRSLITPVKTVWDHPGSIAIEIEEGHREALAVSPTYFDVHRGNRTDDQVVVQVVLGEMDDGLNSPDILVTPERRFALGDLPGDFRHGPIAPPSGGASTEVYLEYSISRA